MIVDRADRGGHGQRLLVGGFALAVVLVALVAVLNSAIYTEILATRHETSNV